MSLHCTRKSLRNPSFLFVYITDNITVLTNGCIEVISNIIGKYG
nr:MAG TPA: hypothetical protein [Caudoviricetes sp.]